MNIDGHTRVYGVLGYPVRHTLSPLLHNAVFKEQGRNAVYLPFEIRPELISGAAEGIVSMGLGGVNVTLPHKVSMVKFCDRIPSEVDRAIGAVNALSIRDGKLLGHNTDGEGFIGDVQEQLGFDPKRKKVLILGAGGAARAVCFYLVSRGCGQIMLFDTLLERANDLAGGLLRFPAKPSARVEVIQKADQIRNLRADLVVNATPCGMKPEDPPPLDLDRIEGPCAVYDLIYSTKDTLLVSDAKRRGYPASNGLGMLIRQAALSQKIWFPDADIESVLDCMRKAYASCR